MQIAPTSPPACSTHGFAYLEILEVTGANSLTVKGDLTGMLTGDERFWIFAPPGVDAQTGAIRGTHTGATFKPAKCDSRYLWAQYRYMPPMAGYEVDPGTPGIYGKQPGTNAAGTYHAWNRQYDPGTGRWTTPDPAMSPWVNLWDYVGSQPRSRTDQTGLGGDTVDPEDPGLPIVGALIEAWRKNREAHEAAEKAKKQAEHWAKEWEKEKKASAERAREEQARKAAEKAKEEAERKVKDRESRDWGKGTTSRGNCWRYASDQPVDPPKHGPGIDNDWFRRVHQVGPAGRAWNGTADDLGKMLKEYGATPSSKEGKCPEGSWKIAAVADELPDPADIHFYRQNADGGWTHKRGNGGVEDVDASGRKITDPETCDRNYSNVGGANYDKFVGFYCVK